MAIAWVGIPPLARWQLESRGSEKLGRAVTVAKVTFAPWKLQTTLEGFEIAGAPGASGPQLHIDKVGFRTALSSLWHGAPVITALRVEGPRLRVARRSEGHYDVDDLIERLSTPDEPAHPPVRFVLRDLKLAGGTIDFDDRAAPGGPVAHTVRNLLVALPVISSLDNDRDGTVQPQIAFLFDGSRFDTAAQALPFAELRRGDATLHIEKLDLARWRSYLPAALPLRPVAGMLDAKLRFSFAQSPQPVDTVLDIAGSVAIDQLQVQGADGHEALSAASVQLDIARLSPLRRSVRLERLALVKPHLRVARTAGGRIDLLPATTGKAAQAPASGATPPTPWTVELAHLAIQDGQVDWRDAATPVAAQIGVRGLQLDASAIAWPMVKPAVIQGRLALDVPKGAPAPSLQFSGNAGLDAGTLAVKADALPLALARPYLQARLRPALDGRLGMDATVAWSPTGVTVEGRSVAVDGLALAQGRQPLLSLRRIAVEDLRLDTTRHLVSAGRLLLAVPSVNVARDGAGRWMFEDWPPAAPAGASPTKSATGPAPAWRVALARLDVDGGQVGWRDATTARPVALDLSALQVKARDLAWPLAPRATFPLELDTRIAAGQSAPGTLQFRGRVAPAPLALDGQVVAARIPVQALTPYAGTALKTVDIVRADLGFKGRLRLSLPPAGTAMEMRGDVALENGRVDSLAAPDAPAAQSTAFDAAARAPSPRGVLTPGSRRASTLLSWRTLQLRNAALVLAPAKPLFWSVQETTLGDFFARLAIDESGRLNLRDLSGKSPGTPSAASPAAPAQGGGVAVSAAPVAKPAAAATTGPVPELHFGPIRVVNGRVNFTDRFVKPSYSASLSELEGQLGAFDSVGAVYAEPAMATLTLKGKAEGSAGLDISGKLNPLSIPLALDIAAKVTDLDLPSLSPYTVKYAGHGIERGKLSMDLHYQIQPDGRLTATNALVLRQLVFSEPVQGAPSSLPVQLAAALLADRNGVIDVNLPVSGSLNDPQFSLAPVIVKALVNLVLRAITSPFTLLSQAFSGSGPAPDTSAVPFAAGSAALSPAARQGLDGVAKVMAERLTLQLTVTGSASVDAEQDGYRRERLRQLALFEKRRALLAAAPTAAAPPVADLQMTPQEYPALLRKVYAATDMPKPRNLVGMAKDIPLEEMERLLSEQIDVTGEAIRSLALARGAAVRDYLAAHGVPASRVFLGAVHLDDGRAANWQPQAALSLSLH